MTPFSPFPGFISKPPCISFYHPNPPLSWIDGLSESFPGCRLFQSAAKSSRHFLHINKLEYPKILQPNLSLGKANKMDLIGGHDRVLALFPNGRNKLYETRNLSQESVTEGSTARWLSERTRKTGRRCWDAYEPEDTYDFDIGYKGETSGSECDDFSSYGHSDGDHSSDDHMEDDISEGDQTEGNLSEDNHTERAHTEDDLSERDISEHHQVTFQSFYEKCFI